MVDLLIEFGTTTKAPGGAQKVFFDKASRRRLAAYMGALPSTLDEQLGVYAVINFKDNTVITVGHRTERIKRH